MAFDRDAHRFFDAIARSRLAIRATALVRMDLCEDTDLLQTMRDAGVCNLSVGIESVREETLTAFRKKTSPGLLAKAIDTFHRYGFSVTGLFIVGYDTEGLESLDRIRDFIDHTGIAKWRVSPLCQTPEVPGQFLPPHRIFTWDELQPFGRETADFMNGEYVFFFPRHIRPSDLQRGILRFNRKMCAWPALVRLWGARRRLWPLILRVGNNFAQRWVQQQVLASRYIQMLETIERPFYERTAWGWALKEGRLERRYVKTANRHRNHCRHGTMDAAAQRLTAVP
jgi:hypothetical protein